MASTSSADALHCQDLHSYLQTLSPVILDKLYSHPAACLAVFRELPELARHYVMRILFVEQSVPQAVVSLWVDNKNQEEHRTAVRRLSELHVWQEQTISGGLPGWILKLTFRTNIKVALLGGGSPWHGGAPLSADKYAKDVGFLDTYALERWECVLKFMVGTTEGSEGVSRDVVEILLHSRLMKGEASDPTPSISAKGFQFLLLETAQQVWFFMLKYLDTVATRGMDLVQCLSFLFQLSFSTLGKDYSTESMSESQMKFLQHLREIGLVYQRKRKSQRYYPTRLAINLASCLTKVKTDIHRTGFIVVETNYRVYAYTDSPLQIALIALFCEMLYRFPNLSVGNLSRESVRQALTRGITAEQKPTLPPTMTDQIRLWELERDRLKYTEGVLYNQFLSQNDYELLRDYANDMSVLTFSNSARRMMVVTRAGHDDVKKFWKRQRQSNT